MVERACSSDRCTPARQPNRDRPLVRVELEPTARVKRRTEQSASSEPASARRLGEGLRRSARTPDVWRFAVFRGSPPSRPRRELYNDRFRISSRPGERPSHHRPRSSLRRNRGSSSHRRYSRNSKNSDSSMTARPRPKVSRGYRAARLVVPIAAAICVVDTKTRLSAMASSKASLRSAPCHGALRPRVLQNSHAPPIGKPGQLCRVGVPLCAAHVQHNHSISNGSMPIRVLTAGTKTADMAGGGSRPWVVNAGLWH